jgi:hypothetical protein
MTVLTTVLHYAPYVVAAASALAPVLPHPDEVEGVLKALTKVINFLALNYDKLVTTKK